MRNMAEKRSYDQKHQNRRLHIIHNVWGLNTEWKPPHYFSKNKVHCSCFMCSGCRKTNSKLVKHNWKHSDRKRMIIDEV